MAGVIKDSYVKLSRTTVKKNTNETWEESNVREQERIEELELPVIILGLLFVVGILSSIAALLGA